MRRSPFPALALTLFAALCPAPEAFGQSLTLDPRSLTLGPGSETTTITLEATVDPVPEPGPDRFRVQSRSPWITVEPSSGLSDFGGVDVTIRARANDDGAQRIGRVVFRSDSGLTATLRVLQRGAADCDPGPDEIVVFADASFFGACTRFALGDYPAAFSGTEVGEDAASSIRVGANVIAEMCANRDFFGGCTVFTQDTTNFVDTDLQDNRASAVSVRRAGAVRCDPGPAQAALYIHSGYRGACRTFGFGIHDVEAIFGGDRVSSALLGPGAEIELREGGIIDREVFLDRSVPNLRSVDFNDEAEELEVFDCAVGSDEVALRRDTGLRGACRVLGPGTYVRSGAGPPLPLDFDGISSVALGSDASVCLCVTDVFLSGGTERTCVHDTATIADMGRTPVGNDSASFVGVGMSRAACSAYDEAGDVETPPGGGGSPWGDVELWNCQLSREPLFAWIATGSDPEFRAVGVRDTDFERLEGPAPCITASSGLTVDLPEGAALLRLVDPVACGASVDGENLTRAEYVERLGRTPQNDPTRFSCLQIDLPVLGGGDETAPIVIR
ncbi:MAG: BACON domain-containing protein [Rubricella sp.]